MDRETTVNSKCPVGHALRERELAGLGCAVRWVEDSARFVDSNRVRNHLSVDIRSDGAKEVLARWRVGVIHLIDLKS